jgi:hypothetical protein
MSRKRSQLPAPNSTLEDSIDLAEMPDELLLGGTDLVGDSVVTKMMALAPRQWRERPLVDANRASQPHDAGRAPSSADAVSSSRVCNNGGKRAREDTGIGIAGRRRRRTSSSSSRSRRVRSGFHSPKYRVRDRRGGTPRGPTRTSVSAPFTSASLNAHPSSSSGRPPMSHTIVDLGIPRCHCRGMFFV